MIPVPETTALDIAFGNIAHMPKWDNIPEEFHEWRRNKYCDFISSWFYRGLDEEACKKITPKPGVDFNDALAAIRAILASFEPKHEHKIAGCGYLLSQWFELEG